MTTFQVQPSTPYDIEIGQPGIAGTPTPVVSYAWTYNGASIGGNSRVVNDYTFASFPGTLACTITLTNIVGSVSQTVTATIEQVSNLPTLSTVTIRNNSAPTVPISTIANGNTGVVLRVGGPTSADVNPIAANATTVSYQWRRGASNIAGAIGQTYTLVAADEDQTLSVVVTATNLDGSTTRTAAVVIGEALPNAASRIGTHLPSTITHSYSEIAFANLMYSAQCKWLGGNRATNTNPSTLWEDHAGDPFCTADGWPIKNIDGTPLSTSRKAEAWLAVNSKERGWSILQIPGEYTTPSEGESPLAPDNIRGRWAKYTITAYWEGTGTVRFIGESQAGASIVEQAVTFSGPLNEGPWGTGPVNMTMRRFEGRETGIDCDPGQMHVYIQSTDQNDPVRNLVVLVKDVRWWIRSNDQDPGTLGEVIYEGMDHTTYRPYALYPAWYEKMKRMSIMRNHDQTKIDLRDNAVYASQTSEDFDAYEPGEVRTVRRVGWAHPPNNYGFETGYGPLNRPTHVLHGVSLKAQIEICNQLRAHWWHSHPANVVYAGTRTAGQPDEFAATDEIRSVLVDQEYITNLVPFVAQTLAPGLKIYSEMCNELWNTYPGFNWNHNWAAAMGPRLKADIEFGGDGGAVRTQDVLGPQAYFAGKAPTINARTGRPEKVFCYVGTAILAKEMRDLMPPGGPEIVAVAGAQGGAIITDAPAISQVFMRVPKLFRELDAVAVAPYRSPTFDPTPNEQGRLSLSPESDQQLALLGSTAAAWQYLEDSQKQLEPYSSPIGALDSNGNEVLSETSFWAVTRARNRAFTKVYLFGYPWLAMWKHFALDVPFSAQPDAIYTRYNLWQGAPARRWNLKLLYYEAGNHYIPNFVANENGPRAKELFAGVVMAPPYRRFMRRYYEVLFAPNIRGATRDPASGTTESEIYRPGMVPNGIAQEREPIADQCVMLRNIQKPNYRNGMYWGLAWFNSQVNAPQYVGLEESVDLGIGTPNWWVNYTGYLE